MESYHAAYLVWQVVSTVLTHVPPYGVAIAGAGMIYYRYAVPLMPWPIADNAGGMPKMSGIAC